jgi:DNA-binding NtrC family response regulator
MAGSILLIDDDADLIGVLGRFFERKGWTVFRASEGEAAVELFEAERPDLVIQDMQLPGLSGLELLEALRRRDPEAAVLVLTGNGDVPLAVQALHLGAENFLVKPVAYDHLDAAVQRAYEKVLLRRRTRFLVERHEGSPEPGALGDSPVMRHLSRQIELVSGTDSTVLLQGETGTGKSWAARLIHSSSPRAGGPFVEVNCGGLTAAFLDSELFGHERGAFTDAKAQKRGLFEVANGGTLFLDEIGELAPELQPKLLHVLESRTFRRLGGTREIQVDVRLVAATNRPLEADVQAGKFREDLYYRLSVLPLRLPPLRERSAGDVADLACRQLREIRAKLGRGPERISAEALAVLTRHAWPGNIRELRNVLERVLITAVGAQEIGPEHLPPELHGALPRATGAAAGPDPQLSLEEVERRHIARVLEHCRGNRAQAARVLGIARRTLYEKLHRYSLA